MSKCGTFLDVGEDELELGQSVDADEVGLHFLTVFLRRVPVCFVRVQFVTTGLKRLPADVTVVFLIIRPRVWKYNNQYDILNISD